MTSPPAAVRAQKKSTTGRTATEAVRLWLRTASRVAPAVAESHAATLFCTPGRRGHGGFVPTGLLPGLPGPVEFSFTLESGRRVAAYGWGSGPTALLLHGWGGAARGLSPLAGALVAAGRRVVLVDFPAHGRSDGRTTSLVEWLGVLDLLGAMVGEIDLLVGHSFGGAAAAIGLAERRIRARRAALLAPALGPAAFLERFAAMTGLSAERAEGMVRRVEARVGRAVASLDVARAVASARLSLPALVLHDPADREVPFAHGSAIAAAWLGARLVRCEGAGHSGLQRDPRAIAAVVRFAQGG
jgi:pimeloyl-ACP methyl ester carboxylesterase